MTARASSVGADRVRMVVRGLGQTLITAGVVILLFVVYELWVTGLYTSREQHTLRNDLFRQWAQPPAATAHLAPAKLGTGIAYLRIPRLGKHYGYVVVEGVGEGDLQKGPGHYPGTAMPGQVGNFVVSGHRTTYLAPFNRLDELRHGDAIVVETRTAYFTYAVTTMQVVEPTDVAVIDPVPNRPGASPTQRLLTFTTCNPKYSARQRLVVHGQLVNVTSKASHAVPPALRGIATIRTGG